MKCTVKEVGPKPRVFTTTEVVILLDTWEEATAFKHLFGCWKEVHKETNCVVADDVEALAGLIFHDLPSWS